jgi:hypothetical protein
MGSHAIYSDDHGTTWKMGATIKPGVNECQVVELADGSLMMNMRSYHRKGCRAVSISKDGGETWSGISHATDLPEPVCQASIIRYSAARDKGKNRILFSNPAWEERVRLTVRMSYNEGKTWPVSKLLYSGPSGYSNLAVLPDGSLVLIEEVKTVVWPFRPAARRWRSHAAFLQRAGDARRRRAACDGKGRHSMKAGFAYRTVHTDFFTFGMAGAFSFSDGFTWKDPTRGNDGSGSDLASLLLGYPSAGSAIRTTKLFDYVHGYAGFVHEDFRVTRKLTLNLGLRYEYGTGVAERDNRRRVGFDRNVASPFGAPARAA